MMTKREMGRTVSCCTALSREKCALVRGKGFSVKPVRFVLVAVLGALLTLFAVGSSSASAAPAAAAPSVCGGYGSLDIGATMSVSTTTPFPGQSFTLTGANFEPSGSTVTIKLDTGDVLAHVTINSTGSFSIQITMPAGVTGNHLILADGYAGQCPPDPVQVSVQASGNEGQGGGLASTGVDILTGIAIALALIAGGVLLARSGRRRHSHS